VKITVLTTEEVRFHPARAFTLATLDAPYYEFAAFSSLLPRPSARPHHETHQLYVRLTRPDGTLCECAASIPLIGGHNPPAKITIEGVSPEDVPAGTEVTLLRYEVQACPTSRRA
jgi:hypothetical protein